MRKLVIGVVIAAAIAGASLFVVTKNRPTVQLALRFKQGQQLRYSLDAIVQARLGAKTKGAVASRADSRFKATYIWKVASVKNGIATIDVSAEQVSLKSGGTETILPASRFAHTLLVGTDGKVHSFGHISLSTSGSGGAGFFGMDEMLPWLTNSDVHRGSRWKGALDEPFSLGTGRIKVSTESELTDLRIDKGKSTAVVLTKGDLPLKIVMAMRKVFELAHLTDLANGIPSGSEPKIEYGGDGSFAISGEIDQSKGVVTRSVSRGEFDMTIHYSGLPDQKDSKLSPTFRFNGSYSLTLVRL